MCLLVDCGRFVGYLGRVYCCYFIFLFFVVIKCFVKVYGVFFGCFISFMFVIFVNKYMVEWMVRIKFINYIKEGLCLKVKIFFCLLSYFKGKKEREEKI